MPSSMAGEPPQGMCSRLLSIYNSTEHKWGSRKPLVEKLIHLDNEMWGNRMITFGLDFGRVKRGDYGLRFFVFRSVEWSLFVIAKGMQRGLPPDLNQVIEFFIPGLGITLVENSFPTEPLQDMYCKEIAG